MSAISYQVKQEQKHFIELQEDREKSNTLIKVELSRLKNGDVV